MLVLLLASLCAADRQLDDDMENNPPYDISLAVSNSSFSCPDDFPCKCEELLTSPEVTEIIVDCSKRELSDIPDMSHLEDQTLDKVYLNDNRISRILNNAFKGLRIKMLDLSDNNIQSVSDNAFVGLLEVEELLMVNCGLTVAPMSLEDIPSLKRLHLQKNTIRDLQKRCFEKLVDLEYLDLSDNPVKLSAPFDAFDMLRNLRELRMANCSIAALPLQVMSKLVNLEHLVLRDNDIVTIEVGALDNADNLREVNLENNPLNINSLRIFQHLHHLKVLKVSGCDISNLDADKMSHFRGLRSFGLSRCHLEHVAPGTFKDLTHLNHLDLGGNPGLVLSQQLFQDLHGRLEYIGLQEMNLSRFPSHVLRHLRALKKIKLNSNYITELEQGDLAALNIRHPLEVHLERNNISTISPYVADGVGRPLKLYLQHNNITSLEFIEDSLCSFDEVQLHLANNPIHCDCTAHRVVQKKVVAFYGSCQTPLQYKGIQLSPHPKHFRNKGPNVGDLEHFANGNCSRVERFSLRYNCACGMWQSLDRYFECAGAEPLGKCSLIGLSLALALALLTKRLNLD